jgi:hypothetical protein
MLTNSASIPHASCNLRNLAHLQSAIPHASHLELRPSRSHVVQTLDGLSRVYTMPFTAEPPVVMWQASFPATRERAEALAGGGKGAAGAPKGGVAKAADLAAMAQGMELDK